MNKNKWKIIFAIAIIVAACPTAYLTFKYNADNIFTLAKYNMSNKIVQLALSVLLLGLLIVIRKMQMNWIYASGYVLSSLIGFVGYFLIEKPDMLDYYPCFPELSLIFTAIWFTVILAVTYSKMGRVYLPALITWCPISIMFYGSSSYHNVLVYSIVAISVILQIGIAIFANTYAARKEINRWRNFAFGTVSFCIINLLAALALSIFGHPFWYIVVPLPYIITSLITMHFVKPRKVLAEKGEQVASDLSV